MQPLVGDPGHRSRGGQHLMLQSRRQRMNPWCSAALPLALLLLLVVAIDHACSFVPSAFVVSKSERSSSHQISNGRRRVISYSSLSQDHGDDTFFLRASQEAAQQRMQQLKEGGDPLAISLSAPLSDDETATTDEREIEGDSKETDEGDNQETIESQPVLEVEDIEIPIDTPLLDDNKGVKTSSYGALLESMSLIEGQVKEGTEKVQSAEQTGEGGESISDEAEQKLPVAEGETSVVEEIGQTESVDVADDGATKDLTKPCISAVDGDTTASEINEKEGAEKESEQNQPSPVQEVKIPIDPFEAQQREKETVAKSQSEADTPQSELDSGSPLETLDSETDRKSLDTAQTEEEASTITEPKPVGTEHTTLSSDGKEIFEPSPSSLKVNQENVDMGLLVLTNAMMTLKAIVDKDED